MSHRNLLIMMIVLVVIALMLAASIVTAQATDPLSVIQPPGNSLAAPARGANAAYSVFAMGQQVHSRRSHSRAHRQADLYRYSHINVHADPDWDTPDRHTHADPDCNTRRSARSEGPVSEPHEQNRQRQYRCRCGGWYPLCLCGV